MQQDATQWTRNQRRFIEWVATPDELKEHRKVADFAASIGLERTTLWRWRKLPGFNEAVQQHAMQYLGDALPEVLASFKDMARRGNFQHQKTYFEMLGIYTPPKEQREHTGEIVLRVVYDTGSPDTGDTPPDPA